MPNTSAYRKPPRTPPGCEDHLTRQQAAQLLGFSSEFKIRQLEREGRLQSVRGPMRTAFYAHADLLAVKAELGREVVGREAADGWSDAELLLLLGSPTRDGRQRAALDLVLETRISIERAERVFAFWAGSQSGPGVPLRHGQARRSQAETGCAPAPPPPQAPKSAPPPAAKELSLPAQRSAAERPPTETATIARASASAKAAVSDPGERRGEHRLSRDTLISQLRDPNPRVRDRAFALLKELQASR